MNTVTRYVYTGLGMFIGARAALAQIDPGLGAIDQDIRGVGADANNPISTIQSFVSNLLFYLGLIMVFMALWGGWKVLTSGSEDEGKEAGKKIIINAVIGIVVIFFAWTITSLVFGILGGGGKLD